MKRLRLTALLIIITVFVSVNGRTCVGCLISLIEHHKDCSDQQFETEAEHHKCACGGAHHHSEELDHHHNETKDSDEEHSCCKHGACADEFSHHSIVFLFANNENSQNKIQSLDPSDLVCMDPLLANQALGLDKSLLINQVREVLKHPIEPPAYIQYEQFLN